MLCVYVYPVRISYIVYLKERDMVLCENGISYMSQSYLPTYSRKGNFFFLSLIYFLWGGWIRMRKESARGESFT